MATDLTNCGCYTCAQNENKIKARNSNQEWANDLCLARTNPRRESSNRVKR